MNTHSESPEMSVPPAIFQIAQEGNHLTYSRLPTNRNFVHGGPTGRAAQVHVALGKREDTTMTTPDKNQPKKHFFKIRINFYELRGGEKNAWNLLQYIPRGDSLFPLREFLYWVTKRSLLRPCKLIA